MLLILKCCVGVVILVVVISGRLDIAAGKPHSHTSGNALAALPVLSCRVVIGGKDEGGVYNRKYILQAFSCDFHNTKSCEALD